MNNIVEFFLTDTPKDPNHSTYTVSEISLSLKKTLEKNFDSVKVCGEISGYNGPHSSGHTYFSIKDDRSRLEAVIWKGTMQRLQQIPEEGMEMIATGKITTYGPSSKYQMIVENLVPSGTGTLHLLLDERRKRLEAEGIFSVDHKKNLPFLPKVIGVITSPTGAVIRDIIHRIRDRFPLHILIWPVRVQGLNAHHEIMAAIKGFNDLSNQSTIPVPDIFIIARGGGSIEDLWIFNDEALVRAIYHSKIPIISAIGHETDWTLCDLVADIRAPTPTAAAEMATPEKKLLLAKVDIVSQRVRYAITEYIQKKYMLQKFLALRIPSSDIFLGFFSQRFDQCVRFLTNHIQLKIERKKNHFSSLKLTPKILQNFIEKEQKKIEISNKRMHSSLASILSKKMFYLQKNTKILSIDFAKSKCIFLSSELSVLSIRQENILKTRLVLLEEKLSHMTRFLESVSYHAILSRGFAMITDSRGNIIKQACAIAKNELLTIKFSDGTVSAVIIDSKEAKPS